MKFQTISNYDYTQHYERVTDHVSMTVPDQSLTIREIFDRYTHGLPLDIVSRTGYAEYDGDDTDASQGTDSTLDRPDVDILDVWLLNRELESIREDHRRKRDQQEASDRAAFLAWREAQAAAAASEESGANGAEQSE